MLPALKIDILHKNGCGCQRKICNVGKHCLKLLLFICGVEFWELVFMWCEKNFSFIFPDGFFWDIMMCHGHSLYFTDYLVLVNI